MQYSSTNVIHAIGLNIIWESLPLDDPLKKYSEYVFILNLRLVFWTFFLVSFSFIPFNFSISSNFHSFKLLRALKQNFEFKKLKIQTVMVCWRFKNLMKNCFQVNRFKIEHFQFLHVLLTRNSSAIKTLIEKSFSVACIIYPNQFVKMNNRWSQMLAKNGYLCTFINWHFPLFLFILSCIINLLFSLAKNPP